MTPEFSVPIRIDTIGAVPRVMTIAADAATRAALAERFDLVALDRLEARAELIRQGEAILATGQLSARVTQACVASGDPVPATIDELFALRFLPDAAAPTPEEIELDAGDLDDLTYADGEIDLGEAVAQTLGLALDPFPRAAKADAALQAAGVVGEEEAGPFGALKALKDKLAGG